MANDVFYFSVRHGNNLKDPKFSCNKYHDLDIKRIYKCHGNITLPADDDAFTFQKLITANDKLNGTTEPYLIYYHINTKIKGNYMFVVGFANIPVYSKTEHTTLKDHTGKECKFDALWLFPYDLNVKDQKDKKDTSNMITTILKGLISVPNNGLSSLIYSYLKFIYKNNMVNAEFNKESFYTAIANLSHKNKWPKFDIENNPTWLDDGYVFVYYPNSNKTTLLDPPIKDTLMGLGKVAGAAIGTYAGAKMLSSETYRNWIQEFIANNPESNVILQTILNNPKSSIVLGAIGTYLAAKGLPALGRKFTAFIKEKLGIQSST